MNLILVMLPVKTVARESNLEELKVVTWDVEGLSDVINGEIVIVLKEGHIFLTERRVELLI